MSAAPIPEDEELRLAALAELEILDTPPEQEFDHLVELAARISGAPMALISLVDRERQWFKARVGLDARETPRELAFCAHAILGDGIFVVPDATADPRFADSPLVVGAPKIRFYAGVVLASEAGHRLGTLCVIDQRPREASQELRASLTALARTTSSLLELRRRRRGERAAMAEQARTAHDLRRSTELLRQISEAQRDFLVGAPAPRVFGKLLDALVAASESEYGFIGEVLRDGEGQTSLQTHAITDIAWDEPSRRMFAERGPGGMTFSNLNTLFGAVTREGATVIANAPASDPRRGGLPPGHPPLRAFLGVPCFAGGELVGMLGVANRAGGYSERDVEALGALTGTCAALFSHLRVQRLGREAEAERRRSEARLAAIIESANEAIVCLDRALAIRTWNPEAARIFGWTAEEAIGRDSVEMLAPASRRVSARANLEAALVGGAHLGQTLESEGLTRDGGVIPVEVSLARVAWGDEVEVSAFLRDTRARRAAERELRARSDELARLNAELSEALRIKDEFLATVSHELRTPLQAVIGRSASLLAGHHGALSAAQGEVLRTIGASGELLLQLINDLLDLTKVEAQQLELKPGIVDVAGLVDACVALVGDLAGRKSLRIAREIEADLPRLRLDPLRFEQVLINVLGNAVKFTPEGSIVVRARLDPAGPRLVVEVEDTGIGIPADQLERIFEPFTQVESGLRRRHAGTGLGLALTRRLVELFGGTIAVKSALGVGSTFTVSLPVQTLDVAGEHQRQRAAVRQNQRLRVLFADDNEINVLTISAFLAASGHEVVVAHDGAEAVAQFEAHRPDVVLLDLQMPNVDGIEAARRIRAMPELGQPPIIALTAMGRSSDRERCREAGFDAFVTKPVTPEALDAVIAAVAPRRAPDA